MASMLRERPSSRLGTPSRSPIGTPPRSPSPWFVGTPIRTPIGTPRRPAPVPWFDDYHQVAAAGPNGSSSLEYYTGSTPTRRAPAASVAAEPGSPGPAGFGTPQRITIMGRELEVVDVRTPQGPHEGTNNWGGASPLLSVNVPKESLGSSYLKFNAFSDDDDEDDDDNFRGSSTPLPPVVTLDRKDGDGDGDGEKKKKKKRDWILAKLGWKKKKKKEEEVVVVVVVLDGGEKSRRGWRPRWSKGW